MFQLVNFLVLASIYASGGIFSFSKIEYCSKQFQRISKTCESRKPNSSCRASLEASSWQDQSYSTESESGGINPGRTGNCEYQRVVRRLQASTLSQDITRRPKSAGNSSKCSTTKMRRKTAGGRVRPSISNGFPKAKSACLSAHWRLPGRSKSPEGSQGTVQACLRHNATQMTAGAKISFQIFCALPPAISSNQPGRTFFFPPTVA